MMSSGEIKWIMKSKIEKGLKYHQVLKKKWVLSIKINWSFKNKDRKNNFQVQVLQSNTRKIFILRKTKSRLNRTVGNQESFHSMKPMINYWRRVCEKY